MTSVQFSLFTEYDIYLFCQGKHYRLFEKLGSHITEVDGQKGTYFAVWAPNAASVCLIGEFNDWKHGQLPMQARWDDSGIWEAFVPKLEQGTLYKYTLLL